MIEVTDNKDHIQKYWSAGVFYEADLLLAIKEQSVDFNDGIILDIGAHMGNHTVFFSKCLKKDVIAIEPSIQNFTCLKKNIKLNKLNVQAFNIALSSKDGKAKLANKGVNNTGMYEISNHGEIIDIFSLDSFVEKNNIEKISFIKIDVEGYVRLVLSGGRKTIRKNKPYFAIETDDPKTILKRLKNITKLDYFVSKRYAKTPTYIFSPKN